MKMIKKLKVRLKRMLLSKSDCTITREERCLMVIVRKLLNLIGSELYMNIQGVDEIYIVSEDKTVFVCIDYNSNTAKVINHHFGYDLKISNRVLNYILNIFYAEAKKRRDQMKDEYRSNIQYSLSTVITNLSKLSKNETHTDS